MGRGLWAPRGAGRDTPALSGRGAARTPLFCAGRLIGSAGSRAACWQVGARSIGHGPGQSRRGDSRSGSSGPRARGTVGGPSPRGACCWSGLGRVAAVAAHPGDRAGTRRAVAHCDPPPPWVDRLPLACRRVAECGTWTTLAMLPWRTRACRERADAVAPAAVLPVPADGHRRGMAGCCCGLVACRGARGVCTAPHGRRGRPRRAEGAASVVRSLAADGGAALVAAPRT